MYSVLTGPGHREIKVTFSFLSSTAQSAAILSTAAFPTP